MSTETPSLRNYEVTWLSGHVETIRASQVTWPSNSGFMTPDADPFIRFMGHVDGQWTLVLQARERELRSVRDVTTAESLS